jgi:hypothetical protein
LTVWQAAPDVKTAIAGRPQLRWIPAIPARANADEDGSNRARTEQQKDGGAVAEQQEVVAKHHRFPAGGAAMSASNRIFHGYQPSKMTVVA